MGLGKLTIARSTSDSWWIEGLRTHPDFEGRGVASQTFRYLIHTWRQVGSGRLRLATHCENFPIHHLCEQNGFRKLGELVIYKAAPLDEAGHHFKPILADEAAQVLARLEDSALLEKNLGVIDMGWVWTVPTLQVVGSTIEAGLGWWWNPTRNLQQDHIQQSELSGLVLVMIDPEVETGPAQWIVQGLDCPEDQLAQCLHEVRCLAFERGAGAISWNLANRPELVSAAQAAGFERAWDLSLFIYAISQSP